MARWHGCLQGREVAHKWLSTSNPGSRSAKKTTENCNGKEASLPGKCPPLGSCACLLGEAISWVLQGPGRQQEWSMLCGWVALGWEGGSSTEVYALLPVLKWGLHNSWTCSQEDKPGPQRKQSCFTHFDQETSTCPGWKQLGRPPPPPPAQGRSPSHLMPLLC